MSNNLKQLTTYLDTGFIAQETKLIEDSTRDKVLGTPPMPESTLCIKPWEQYPMCHQAG
jgi:hypothetical protein